MIALSNFNAKMNSLKEVNYATKSDGKRNVCFQLAKLIENATYSSATSTRAPMRREVISDWVIENSVLSKALEGRRLAERCSPHLSLCRHVGNIDQNQYVDKVRILLEFIAPRILKEEIATIWKMQVRTRGILDCKVSP